MAKPETNAVYVIDSRFEDFKKSLKESDISTYQLPEDIIYCDDEDKDFAEKCKNYFYKEKCKFMNQYVDVIINAYGIYIQNCRYEHFVQRELSLNEARDQGNTGKIEAILLSTNDVMEQKIFVQDSDVRKKIFKVRMFWYLQQKNRKTYYNLLGSQYNGMYEDPDGKQLPHPFFMKDLIKSTAGKDHIVDFDGNKINMNDVMKTVSEIPVVTLITK